MLAQQIEASPQAAQHPERQDVDLQQLQRIDVILVPLEDGAALHGGIADHRHLGQLGLPCDVPNHASYIASWIRTLREDKREIFRAASDAQKIADYLLAFHPEYAHATQPVDPADEGDGAGHGPQLVQEAA